MQENRQVTFINLTKSTVRIYNNRGDVVLVVPPSGLTVRLSERVVERMEVNNGVTIERVVIEPPEVLPPPRENTFLIVPSRVAAAVSGRSDLVSPGGLVYDPNTRQPIGARSLRIIEQKTK